VLADLGAELLAQTLAEVEQGRERGTPQTESEATYCRLVRKQDGRLDWNREAADLERMIRAYHPWPGAFTTFRGQVLHLLEAGVCPLPPPAAAGPKAADAQGAGTGGLVFGTDNRYGILVLAGQGVVSVTRLQLQAKKPMDWRSFLNGRKDFVGSQLGVDDD